MIKHFPTTLVGPVMQLGRIVKRAFHGKVKAAAPRFVLFYIKVGAERRAVILVEVDLYSAYSNGKRVEALRLLISRGESIQSFSQWVYEEGGELCGAGLFLPGAGRHLHLYFQLPEGDHDYSYWPNDYIIKVYSVCVGEGEQMVRQSTLKIDTQQAEMMKEGDIGIEFTWQEASKRYVGRRCPVKTYSEKISQRY